MITKTKIKTAADILMTAALPVLMCYSIVGEMAHEIVGVAMFVLFILHHILNFGWVKSLFKGRYGLKRIVGTIVNAAVLVCMIGLMYSSLVISKHIFAFIDIGGTSTARNIHILCAYWGLVLMSVHLGMHISQIAARVRLKNKVLIWCLRIASALLSAVGIYEFVQLKLTDCLLGRVQFVFVDTSASAVLTALQYACVMVLFAEAGYLLNNVLTAKKSSEK